MEWGCERERRKRNIQDCILAFWPSFMANCWSSCLSRSDSLERSRLPRPLPKESMVDFIFSFFRCFGGFGKSFVGVVAKRRSLRKAIVFFCLGKAGMRRWVGGCGFAVAIV